MEALLCKRLGDPTSSSEPPIELTQNHPIPKLDSPTAVRIKIKATSLTFATYLKILGKYQEKHPLPFIPGSDYAGTVDAVGPSVTKFKVGDYVCAVSPIGSFATFIVQDQSRLYEVPKGCDLVAATGLPVAFGTSHLALVLLVLGAAGGVGLAAVQIGKICGVVSLLLQDVTASIKEFLKSRNLKEVDVLYDPVGDNLAKETGKLLNWGAQILVIGFASGEIPVIPANIILVKNWTVHGFYWGSYRIHQPAVLEDSVRELLSWMEKGLITVHISHSYSPSKANLAFSAIKDRKAIGKVMIVFDDLGTRLGDPTSSFESPIELSRNHPIPELDSPTAVRVKVKATSLNYGTYLQIQGKYQEKHPLPFIPGSDYAGIVDAVGPSVSKFKVGDYVCAFVPVGSYATFVVQDQSQLFEVPKGCDLVAAAGLPIAFVTSHLTLVLLVLGAAGGVGLAAVQLGKICGAVVIAVARGTEKVQLLKSLGVDHVVDLMNQNVTASVKEFLKSRNLKGVDVLYDPVGGNLAKETMKLLNWGAQILVIGFASGEIPIIPTNIILVKNWTVHGFYWGSYIIHQPAVLEDSVRELFSWMEKGLITVHVSHTYSLSEANLAFSAIKDRKAMGKVMIVFDDKGNASSKL
ncbi:quinone oxidoreductase-like protein 2-like protein [Gossypium australe]|uniref:Quinone oxidoreductase-like protein 2-like protein n=1 Tax=Gossypium australe TaxID=47621 RepID=A0A5B6UBI6_9ROSI|nr:quinone oxidoreductase-like protein 2-like protein [Gossypium australe]